jgi:hypothetical protein
MSEALKVTLLKYGGESVAIMPEPEGVLDKLLSRGQVWSGLRARKIAGARNRCHGNSALAYFRFSNNQTKWKSCKIMTGYAMASDSIWRQHSWLLVDGRLVDTTMTFELYFGIILSDVEACQFVMQEVFDLAGIDEFKEALDKTGSVIAA